MVHWQTERRILTALEAHPELHLKRNVLRGRATNSYCLGKWASFRASTVKALIAEGKILPERVEG